MTATWREFLHGTAMINRAKDYGLAHPGATEEQTLRALEVGPAKDNGLYVRTGLFLASREREDTAVAAAGGGTTRATVAVVKEGDRSRSGDWKDKPWPRNSQSRM